MKPATLTPASSLATLRSGFCSLLGFLLLGTGAVHAQLDSSKTLQQPAGRDSSRVTYSIATPTNPLPAIDPVTISLRLPGDTLTRKQKNTRTWIVAGGNIAFYTGSLIALNSLWYKDYPRTSFHTFNDWPEWQQVDKVGHLYSAYAASRGSMELWRWTGIDRKKRIWIGGMSGAVYQTVIEVLDGYSEAWGWSWGDIGANLLGSGALVAQELAWNDQRIKLKFSFHNRSYNDPELNARSKDLFGTSTAQRFMKDYNGQTYWASANLRSFMPASNLPAWLSVAVGYGAEGMFGGRENMAKDDNGSLTFHRPDIKRYRQWYLAPDIDFTKIPTNKKGLKFLFTVLSAFKFPAPALEFSNGKLRAHAVYF